MGKKTGIIWTDATVNFWWGCTKVSPACDFCYAEAWDKRTGGAHWGLNAPRKKIKSAVSLIRRLDREHAEWSRSLSDFGLVDRRRRVFTQSMSDLFDLEAPVEWFEEAWIEINRARHLSIQMVTKRISVVERRIAEIGMSTWPQHAGLIITVCNQQEADRDIPRLLSLKARLCIPWVGLSVEPMLGAISLRLWIEDPKQLPREMRVNDEDKHLINALEGITTVPACHYQCPTIIPQHDLRDGKIWTSQGKASRLGWVICGGESGAHARDNNFEANARDLLNQCRSAGVPFFGKQNVGKRPLPADLDVQEFPEAA
ncbi:MAG: DUF5131 family protein [Dechloromonas sp.]|nr:DUF5131 family protein [Dechloromonas sp.]